MNKKGISIIELIASIILISIVLVFAMQLFLKVRIVYLTEKDEIIYELNKSIIIDNVIKDIEDSSLSDISPRTNVTAFNIDTNHKISVSGDSIIYENKSLNKKVVRTYPEGTTIGKISVSSVKLASASTEKLYEINIPVTSADKVSHSIDIMFILSS